MIFSHSVRGRSSGFLSAAMTLAAFLIAFGAFDARVFGVPNCTYGCAGEYVVAGYSSVGGTTIVYSSFGTNCHAWFYDQAVLPNGVGPVNYIQATTYDKGGTYCTPNNSSTNNYEAGSAGGTGSKILAQPTVGCFTECSS